MQKIKLATSSITHLRVTPSNTQCCFGLPNALLAAILKSAILVNLAPAAEKLPSRCLYPMVSRSQNNRQNEASFQSTRAHTAAPGLIHYPGILLYIIVP